MRRVFPLLLLLALLLAGCQGEAAPAVRYDLDQVPAYAGEPYVVINDNQPFFGEEEYTTEAFETYSALDGLGRCGTAYACVGEELMPTEARESISSVKPSGWINVEYGGQYLYNRCHLIGFQLTGENANERNLITGTRYMNVEGMLPFENLVADYVKETSNHVLYRVTPLYEGDNLVASGVLMEAGRPCWTRAIPPAASASRKAKPPRSLAPRRFFSVPAGRTGPETGRRTGWGRGRPPAAGAGAGCTCGGRGRRSPWTPWRWTAPPTSAPT